MYVMFGNLLAKLIDSIRGSMFSDYKRLYPDKKVTIEICDTKQKKEVKLKELIDHSIYRNT